MTKNKQTINCNVDSCDFNNCNNHQCILDQIKVSCDSNCNRDNVIKKSETICASFKSSMEKE